MDTTSQYFILGLIIAFVFHRAQPYFWTKPTLLRGPPRNSWLLGHEGVLRSQTNVCELEERWTQEYGTIFRVGGFYGHDTLLVSDGKALQHIFTLVDRYPKGADEERFLRAIFGPGLVTVSRSVHQRQRRIINPAFAAPQLRAFMEAMHISGAKMVDKVKSEIERDNNSIVNVMDWMTRTAIDVLGISTFRHEFGALDGRKEAIMISEMHRAAIQEASTDPSLLETLVMSLMRVLPPWTTSLFALLPTTENRKLRKFRHFSRNFAAGIMKSVLLDEDEAGTKDVVGLLLAAGQETKDPAKKMSENEVLAQISTVLAAGEDTTSITMAFLLYELTRHPADQERVRKEISDMYATKLQNGESFKAKDYDDLPFLNAVIKETLRLHPNLHTLARRASQDDVLPLAEAVTLANGVSTKTVPIAKGQNFLMSMRTYNRLLSVWGADSNSWNPLRFQAERNKQVTVGLYANLITFSAGPQGCIGWQFAVAELQVLTVLMVRHFELRTTVGIREVQSIFSIYPAIEGKEAEGHQLPLELRVIL